MLRLASAALFAVLTILPIRAQTGSPTASQNQGTRPVGPNPQPPDAGFVGTTLFAYGPALSTDIALTRGDDNGENTNANATTTWVGKGPEGSSLAMNFGGRSYGSMIINTNGILSFGTGISSFTSGPLTGLNTPVIAPFFADVDNRANPNSATPSGNIWYRTTQNATELAAIATRVENSFLGAQNFNPTFAQIVTWDKVGRYVSNSGPDNLQVSTFQAVVASDGVRTYTFFLYPEKGIWWDNGTASSGTFAAVGLAYADGTSFEVAGSRTSSMRDLWFLTNTVPATPGTLALDANGTFAPTVVNGTLTLPATNGTAANVLQLSANAAGHTITSPAAAGSILFNQLLFDDPANTVTFADRVVALANAPDAITAGNITVANNAVLVASATGSINGGTLTLKDDAKLALYATAATTGATSLTFNRTSGTGGTLDLRGFNTTLGPVNSIGTAAGLITNSGATAATLTFDGTGTGNFNGTLQNGTGVLSIAKTGTGTQILSGANTYTGTTTVSGGILQFTQATSFATGIIDATTAARLTVASGATAAFNVGGTGEFTSAQLDTLITSATFASGSALGLDTTNATGGDVTQSAALTGTAGLVKLGSGTLTLSAAHTYTGGTTVSAGTLALGASERLADTGALTLDGGTLALGTFDETVGAFSLSSGTVTGTGALTASSFTFTNTGAASVPATLAGTGALTKSGAGTLSLTGVNSYSGTTTINGGAISISNSSALGSGSLVLDAGTLTNSASAILTKNLTLNSGGGTLQTSGGFITFNGDVSGTGTLTKTGTDILTLAGAHTYTGATIVSAGRLKFSARSGTASALATPSLAIASGAKVIFADSQTYAGTVTGAGVLEHEFSGTTILTGAATHTGGTNIIGGVIQVGASGTTGSLSGNVALSGSGTLAFNRADALTFSGTISGVGSLAQLGTDTLALTGTNTYTGGTTFAAGTLALGSASALGTTGTLSFTGGTLQFSAANTTDYSPRFSTAASQAYKLDTNGQNITLAFALTSSGGSLTKSGLGTLTLTGANTYTGTTTVSAGTLQVGNGGTTGSLASANLVNNAALIFNHSNALTFAGAISGTGSFTKLGLGNLTLSGDHTYSGSTTISAGTLSIGTGGTTGSLTGSITNHATLVFNRADALTHSAAISGTGTVTQSGPGTLSLSGTNTYTGGTTFAGGTLALGSAAALGTTGTLTFTGGALQFSALNTTDYSSRFSTAASQAYKLDTNGQNITLATALTSSGGTLTKSGLGTLTLTGANTYAGPTTISAGTLQIGAGGTTGSLASTSLINNAALTFNRSDALVYGGAISGTGSVTKLGSGTLTLTGANTYTGGTTISNGSLRIGAGGTIGSLAGSITNNAALIFNRSDDLTFDGAISGTGSLTKLAAGSLTLTGDSTYTGSTTLSTGTLQIGAGGTTGSLASSSITNNAVLIFNRSDASAFTGVISGTGTLTKSGSGTLTLSGTNTYTGGTLLAAGTLALGDATALGTTGTLSFTGGTLQFSAANTTDTSARFSNAAAQAYKFDTNNQNVTLATALTSSGGSLTKSGLGTLTLTGTNTFAGPTTISAGTLSVGNGGTTGALASTSVINNAALTFNRSDALAYGGAISGSGTVTKLGAGTLTLTGDNTHNGPTTISTGTLQIGAGGTTGSLASSSITNHAALIFNRSNASAFTGTISGSGTLTKLGAGTLTLSGANTYSGGTTLAAGTLALGSANALGTTGTLSFTGGTLQFSAANTTDYSARFSTAASQAYKFDTNGQSVTFAYPLPYSGTSLTKLGAGTLVLSYPNTFAGGTTISGGTLQIGHDGNRGDISGNITNHGSLVFYNDYGGIYADSISGTGSLTKLSSSYITLTGNHTYTGPTTISAGVLQIGNYGTTGSLASASIVNNAALVFARSDAHTYAGTISGTGSLRNTGAGTLTLSGVNTYTGGTTLQGGTLLVSADHNLGASTAPTILVGGTLQTNTTFTSARATALNDGGGTFRTGTGATLTWGGNISGTGRLTKSGAGTLVLSGTNTYTGGTEIFGGTLVGDTTSLQGAILNNGALTFNQSFNGTYSGILDGSGTLTKTGLGTLTLSDTHSFSGNTFVSAGRLHLTGSLAHTNGNLTVASGGTLSGTGTVGRTTIQSGGRLAPGNSPGTLTFTSGLTLVAGSILDFELGTTSDRIRVSGGTLSGPLSGLVTLNLTDSGGFAAGTYTLFDFTSATTSSFDVADFSFGSTLPGYTFALALAGSTLELTATASAIPEPSTYAALAGALVLGLAALRRRSRR